MHFIQQQRLLLEVVRQVWYTVCFTVSLCPRVPWSESFWGRWFSALWFTFPKGSVRWLTFIVNTLGESSIHTLPQSCKGSAIQQINTKSMRNPATATLSNLPITFISFSMSLLKDEFSQARKTPLSITDGSHCICHHAT